MQNPDLKFLQSHVTKENHYISTTRVPIATKLVKMVDPLDGLPPIKSHDLLISSSREIMWQAKTITSPLSQAHETWCNGDLS